MKIAFRSVRRSLVTPIQIIECFLRIGCDRPRSRSLIAFSLEQIFKSHSASDLSHSASLRAWAETGGAPGSSAAERARRGPRNAHAPSALLSWDLRFPSDTLRSSWWYIIIIVHQIRTQLIWPIFLQKKLVIVWKFKKTRPFSVGVWTYDSLRYRKEKVSCLINLGSSCKRTVFFFENFNSAGDLHLHLQLGLNVHILSSDGGPLLQITAGFLVFLFF